MPTTTKRLAGPLEALDDLAQQEQRVHAHRQKLDAETATISGAFNTNGRRVGGKLAELRSKISDARAAALRDGSDADISALEGEIMQHEDRLAWIAGDRRACDQALDAIVNERREILVGRHSEFVDLARAEADAGEALLATLRAAARDVLEQRAVVQQSLRLVFAGHAGNQPGKTLAAEQDRKHLWASFEPWSETHTPENNALWQSVSTVAKGGG